MKTLLICEQDGTVITEGKFDGPAEECNLFIQSIRDTFYPGKLTKVLDMQDPQMELAL